jgi:hypothetical protein
MRAKAWVMAASRASRVRALAFRKETLTLPQHGSIGDRSGEEGGKYSQRAWRRGWGRPDRRRLTFRAAMHVFAPAPVPYSTERNHGPV